MTFIRVQYDYRNNRDEFVARLAEEILAQDMPLLKAQEDSL
jgi:hypothetical protein